MLSQSKIRAIFLFSLIAVVGVFGFADALSQWQFNQDFKVSDNYVGLEEGMVPIVAMSNSGNSVIVWVEDYTNLHYQLMDQDNNHIGISVPIATSILPYAYNVGMNSIGDFSVVWANNSTFDIFFKRFDSNGTPLGAEVKVNESEISNYVLSLDFAMNNDGNSVVVWENNKDGYQNIFGQYYNSDGAPRGNNFPVTDDPSSAENCAAVAMDGQGNFVVVWIDSTGGNSKLYGKRYNSSCNVLGTEFLIDEWDEFSDSNFPAVAVNNQGYFLVCWRKKDPLEQTNLYGLLFDSQGNATGVQYLVEKISTSGSIDAVLFNDNSSIFVWGATKYQRFASDGSPIGEISTANIETHSPSATSIAGNNAKDFIITWYGKPYGGSGPYFIFWQRYYNDGMRDGPNILVSRKIETNTGQYRPALACNSAGEFVIAWDDKRNKNDYSEVYAQILGSNGEFVRDNFYVIYKLFMEHMSDVVMKNNGSFIVLWLDDNSCEPELEFNLYAKWYDPNGIPSAAFKINDVNCRVWSYIPRVEILPSGGFIIVWTDQRAYVRRGKIYCQRYDANSNPIGANFEINDTVDKLKICQRPSLGVDGNGNFVVAWETDLNGNWDVYGKIFNAEGIPYQANFMINDDGGSSNQTSPAADMLEDGSFVVTWTDTREGNNDVFAQHYDSNWIPVGTNFIVNDGGLTSSQSNPSIAFTPDGKFVIAWQDARNRNDDIYAQKFDADGNKIGGNYRVSDDDGAAIQSNPQVDCSGENIYFTWQDNRIPNEKDDIFARVEPFSGVQHWIDIKQPKAGDKWFINQAQQIKWTCSALGGTVKIELSTDNGNSWKALTSDIAYDAADFDCTPIASEISDECLIKISSNDHPGISDLSDRFNIFKPTKNYVAKQFFNSLDPITLDGNLTEPIWSEVKAESLLCGGEPEQWTANWTDFADLLVTWKAIWSPENNRVYAGIEIADDVRGTLDNNDPQESPFYPFNDESLELYVDGDHSGGFFQGSCLSAQQWLITTENKRILNYYNIAGKFGVYFGNAIQTAVTLGGNGNWVIEAELVIINHFETAARTLAPGDTIGWDVWYNDSDNDAYENGKYVRDHQTGWYYTEQAYENADPFGNLILSDIVVPVELYSFEAFVTDDRVQLKWQTASESSNYGFEVQRSNNGINFEKISFVPGSGTTNSSRSYTFHDKNVSQSMNYYRLKILDYDGNYSFSSIVQVCLSQPKRFHLYANYPNPFNPETTIKYDLADAKLVVIKIYNLSGKETATLVNERQKPGSYSILWNARSVPSGIYLCRMEAGSYRESFKLTILK